MADDLAQVHVWIEVVRWSATLLRGRLGSGLGTPIRLLVVTARYPTADDFAADLVASGERDGGS